MDDFKPKKSKLYIPKTGLKRKGEKKVTLDEAFRIFYEAKQAEGMRLRTLGDYKTHWKYLNEWLSREFPDVKHLAQLKTQILRDYLYYLTCERKKYEGQGKREKLDKHLSPTTISIRLRTLKTMCRFWHANGYLESDIVKNIKEPRQDEGEINAFTLDQIKKLLMQPDISTYMGYRDRILMILLLDCGLRINEALSFELAFIDIKTKTIKLPSSINKNRKKRIVPISQFVIKLLEELSSVNEQYFEESRYLFLTPAGEPLKSYSVRKRLIQYGKKAGIIEDVRVSPHVFRHYFCKNFLLNGGDPFILQKIVGHADIKTTLNYVTMDYSDIVKQHEKFSPIKNLLGKK